MAVGLANRVGTAVVGSPGTGTIVIGAPLPANAPIFQPAWQGFAAANVGEGTQVRYLLYDGAAWEYGPATYTAGTLLRPAGSMTGSIPGQQSSTGSLLNLTAQAQVFITAAAEDFVSGTGVTDGDKTDITVSGGGSTWTIDAGAVSYGKIQSTSAPSILLGRGAGIAGTVQEIILGSGLSMSGTTLNSSGGTGTPGGSPTNFQFNDAGSFGGASEVNASGGGIVISPLRNTAMTLGGRVASLQIHGDGPNSGNVFFGRHSADDGPSRLAFVKSKGDTFTHGAVTSSTQITEINFFADDGTNFDTRGFWMGVWVDGTPSVGDVPMYLNINDTLWLKSNQRVGIGNDTPATQLHVSGDSTITIGDPGGTTGKINFRGSSSGTVTLRPQGGAGTWTLTLPNNAGGVDNVLRTDGAGNTFWYQEVTDGDKGDISVSGGSWFIDNDVVTFAKMQNISASVLLGRGSGAGGGDPEQITLGTGLSMSGTTLSVANDTTTQKVEVVKNSGAVVSTRKQLNFIEGTNITLTIADDAGNNQTDITIQSTASGGGNVSNVGTPVDNQVAVWTTATTIEGDTAFTFDTTADTLTVGVTSGTINVGTTGGTVNAANVGLKGATSGTLTLKTAAVAGTTTLTFPAATFDFSASGGPGRVVKQLTAGGAFSVSAVDLTADVGTSDLPFANLAQGATRSVLGVSGTGPADVASISSSAANQILRVDTANTTLGFGSIDLSTSGAVGTSILASGNGGTGINNGGRTLTISTNSGTIAFSGAATTFTFPATSGTVVASSTFGNNAVLYSNNTGVVTALTVGASGTVLTSNGTNLTTNPPTWTTPVVTGFAAPSANSVTVGAPTAGAASTAIRSDATLQLDQSIAPTWTGQHTHNVARTFASATAANLDDINVQAATTTITGATGSPITRLAKVGLYRPTLSDATAVTVTDAATLYIDNSPLGAGAGPVTITNAWSLLVGAGNVKFAANATVLGDIELGNASDTTLHRSAAGTVQIEGQNILTAATGQPLDATLTALAGLDATAGMVVETAADTFTKRTLTGTANRISIANGSGAAGNPTVDIDSAYVGQATITTLGTITTGTWSASTIVEARGGTNQTTYTTGDILYASATNTLSKLAGNITTAKQYLSQTGSGAVSAAPAWATIAGADITGAALTASNDTNVTLTLGGTPATALLRAASITAGWTGTLGVTRGGTGFGTATQGDIIYSDASNSFAKLAKDANATRYLSNTGTTNNPAWAQINLANGVTGTLPLANGGTGQNLTAPSVDRLLAWDQATAAVKFMASADFTTEAAPAAGDWLIIYDSATDQAQKVDWANLPGAGGGMTATERALLYDAMHRLCGGM